MQYTRNRNDVNNGRQDGFASLKLLLEKWILISEIKMAQ